MLLELWIWVEGRPIAIISLLIALSAHVQTIRHSTKHAKWEEYKETVYQPISDELLELENFAKSCRRKENSQIDEVEAKKFLRELAEQLNDLVQTCSKATNHDSTIMNDWGVFAERWTDGIHDFIETETTNSTVLIPVGLNEKLQECIQVFHPRFRHQRICMTSLRPQWLKQIVTAKPDG